MEEEIKYFEVCFDNDYAMCILGTRKPTIEEAEGFLKEDMELYEANKISEIAEITKDDAYNFYDMENEKSLPVFGKEEKKRQPVERD